jgi:hypothetical protein
VTHKSRKKIQKFHVLKCWMFSLRAECFSCNLDVLYGGLRIGQFKFLTKIFFNSFSAVNFLSSKPLDPDWIRIGIQPKILDPDPYQMNTDPQLCYWQPVRKGKSDNHAGFYGLFVLCSVSDSMKHLDFMWPPAVP